MKLSGNAMPLTKGFSVDRDLCFKYKILESTKDGIIVFTNVAEDWPNLVTIEELATQLVYWSEFMKLDGLKRSYPKDFEIMKCIFERRNSPVWKLLNGTVE